MAYIMARQIYKVEAQIVDANGAFHILDGYPKTFDSKNYQDDTKKAKRRAESDFSEAWSTMLKRDDRQIQTVILSTVSGFVIDTKTDGDFPENEPQPEPEESEEPEE
jgi:hypothetical protein